MNNQPDEWYSWSKSISPSMAFIALLGCCILIAFLVIGCYQEPDDPDLPYSLQNCEGTEVSPYDYEGTVDGVRLFLVAEWCVACSLRVEGYYQDDLSRSEIAQMIILGEDKYEGPPSFETCKSYADFHNIPQDQIFLDYRWEKTWNFLGIRTQGPEWWPWIAVLDGDNVEEARFNLLKLED